MKLHVIGHPTFFKSNSMPRFINLIKDVAKENRIEIESYQANEIFSKFFKKKNKINKWLGYVDSYIIFYIKLHFKIKPNINKKKDLVVFADQALGIYVNIFKKYNHVIHCHDLLAFQSAQGIHNINKTGRFGKIYQRLIYKGFAKGKNFISVSKSTMLDLESLDLPNLKRSIYIYNPLNYPYKVMNETESHTHLKEVLQDDVLNSNFILSVSGGQWYKNTPASIKLLNCYCKEYNQEINYVLVCSNLTGEIRQEIEQSDPRLKIYILSSLSAVQLNALYSLSQLLLFPSIKEGFGWPIIEAFASGTNVLTTNEAPMSEIGSHYAYYLPEKLNKEEITFEQIEAVKNVLSLVVNNRSFTSAELSLYSKLFTPSAIAPQYMEEYKRITDENS